MQTDLYFHRETFELESGDSLPEFQLAYSYIGTLSPQKDNVIWICHALTANSVVTDWWSDMFGIGKTFDPEKHFIICVNMLGSCYGSTEALSIDPHTNTHYFHRFPLLTNRDIVRAFDLLRVHLQIDHIHLLMGGSLGGQQALEWAILRPDVFQHLIPIATNAQHSPWGIAFNESQRLAIESDTSWKIDSPEAGLKGLGAARSIAMLSYRAYKAYNTTQQEASDDLLNDFRASSYQRYQGEKLQNRFNAFAYWTLSKAMDSQNVGRGRGGLAKALALIQARTLVIGVDSDILFPINEQELLANYIPNAHFKIIHSVYGHDGFLIETKQLNQLIGEFFAELKSKPNTNLPIS